MKELENASAKYHISKLEALKVQTQQSLEVMFSKQQGTMQGTLTDVFESGYYHTAYELQKGFNVGLDIAGLGQAEIKAVLSKPWAADGYNFSERIWNNKNKLISEVHNELSRNILTGSDPQKAIDAIAKKMNTSKSNAGRLVMTEEAYFSSVAQQKCFEDLDVEQYEIVATLDSHTSDICRSLDGQHFPMSEYQAGVTAPPFHVNCRSTTVPYFDDEFGNIGERAARVGDGKTYYVPADMTYEQWRAKQNELYGAGTVEKLRAMSYNESADKAQLKKYQELLGKKGDLKSLASFQSLKYDNPDGYAALKTAYADKGIQKRIRSNPAYTTLKVGQQGKHILGHNNYTEGRSYLTVTMDEAQELINKYAGTGEIKRDNKGNWTHKEFVTADRVIGYLVPQDGGEPIPTKRFSISYAVGKDKGAHIVPAKEV